MTTIATTAMMTTIATTTTAKAPTTTPPTATATSRRHGREGNKHGPVFGLQQPRSLPREGTLLALKRKCRLSGRQRVQYKPVCRKQDSCRAKKKQHKLVHGACPNDNRLLHRITGLPSRIKCGNRKTFLCDVSMSSIKFPTTQKKRPIFSRLSSFGYGSGWGQGYIGL